MPGQAHRKGPVIGSIGGTDRGIAAARLSARAFPTARRSVLFTAMVVGAAAGVASFASCCVNVPVSGIGLAVASGAVAIGQSARIRARTAVLTVWGEVAFVAVVCLVPPPWAPVAVLAGALLARLPPRRLATLIGSAGAPRRAWAVVAICSVVLGGVVATTVVAVAGAPQQPVRVDLAHPVTFAPLVLAATVYFLVTNLLTAWWTAEVSGQPIGEVLLGAARDKRPMLAGNLVGGLAVAAVIAVNAAWLAALAPVLWVLHHAYTRQMRAAALQRTWVVLADATRRLNQLDERGVAAAALRGAAEIFAPSEVEVMLELPSGRRRHYHARTRDLTELTGIPEDMPGTNESNGTNETKVATDAGADREILVRSLMIGDTCLGELRLYPSRAEAPSRRRGRRAGAAPGPFEEHAFSTFADAVASALHDAATHRRLQAMTARSAYDAVHDVLTGLNNRSTLLARGNTQLLRLDAEPAGLRPMVALVLLDIDGLRSVNDALSYAAGDDLLRVLARRLSEIQGPAEIMGRLDGDEFAILLTAPPVPGGIDEWTYPVERARQFLALLAGPVEVAGVTIALEASAGVVAVAGGCDMAELLRRADVALRQAKRRATRVVRYQVAADVASRDRLVVLAELRDALITTDQLVVYLQPTVDLVTGRPVGAETLLRWRHPRRGLLTPEEFIGVVEHSDLAGDLTLHVIDLALRIAAGWQAQGLRVPISVNVCARCMLDPTLPAAVEARLAAHGVPPEGLIVEITEAVVTAELVVVDRVIGGLRAIGVQVSVNDFGAESASLAFLTRFAVDEVKIDRAFVAGMTESPETAAIVRATVDLAGELGLRVVAGGVERPDQRAALLALGVTAAQGFLFHGPLDLEDATAALRAAGS